MGSASYVEAHGEDERSLCDIFPSLSPAVVRAQLVKSNWDLSAAAEALLAQTPAASAAAQRTKAHAARPRVRAAQPTHTKQVREQHSAFRALVFVAHL